MLIYVCVHAVAETWVDRAHMDHCVCVCLLSVRNWKTEDRKQLVAVRTNCPSLIQAVLCW